MSKRKRDDASVHNRPQEVLPEKVQKTQTSAAPGETSPPITIQIITGAYEKTLHGFTAVILREKLDQKDAAATSQDDETTTVKFADTFLFDAHTSAIRCLALSPPSRPSTTNPARVILATGGSDERINLYQISATPLPSPAELTANKVLAKAISKVPRNQEVGSLLHHSSGITALHFPNRSKLLSAADDNTIAVSRTRDWTVLSSIKAPAPIAYGRPSGDTLPLGGAPYGVTDFAIHPSSKLMISVGKGERCMRLWNLITGKKAGVLNFETDLLRSVGEGKRSRGEGRKVLWNPAGDEFAVVFERGIAVFGMDSIPRCRILPSPRTKIHQVHYLTVDKQDSEQGTILAISTEDGRIIFYSTHQPSTSTANDQKTKADLPLCPPVAQLGANNPDSRIRIKDFESLEVPDCALESPRTFLLVTCSSDGAVNVWSVSGAQLLQRGDEGKINTHRKPNHVNGQTHTEDTKAPAMDAEKSANGSETGEANGTTPMPEAHEMRQVGKLLGTYETNSRILCLKAFIMQTTDYGVGSNAVAGTDPTNEATTRVEDESVEVIGEDSLSQEQPGKEEDDDGEDDGVEDEEEDDEGEDEVGNGEEGAESEGNFNIDESSDEALSDMDPR
ncbi:hypothetical protein MMC25_000010 [Agyrium rufum]|nr:hypothetical protein [Agyrium rufum]